MTEQNSPLSLPLMPVAEVPAAPAAAPAPAPAAPVQSLQEPAMPQLGLNLGGAPVTAAPVAAPVQPVIPETRILEAVETLTPAERAAIDAFKQKLDITHTDHVTLYGADAQKSLGEFSSQALEAVRTKDAGEVGDMLTSLVTELKGFETDAAEPRGFMKLFAKTGDRIERMKARYSTVSVNVESIKSQLLAHQTQLQEDVRMFDNMYDRNLAYNRQLTLYIIAGQEQLKHVRETELRAAYDKATATGDALDAQAANDLAEQCNRFERKLHDLLLTRQVSLQTGPQIRLLQNNDQLLIERIQSTIANTLPLWTSQMVMALGMHNAQQALKAQRAVTDLTNQLLASNAEKLKMGTIETAREAERGVVDLETLVSTNKSLIDTINEVINIQREGREKRAAAEVELQNMEAELRAKLLQTAR